MATFSGVKATTKVGGNAIPGMRKWTFKTATKLSEYVSNETGGWSAQCKGARNGAGELRINLDSSRHLPYDDGDEVTLLLYPDSDNAVDYIEVPAIFEECQLEEDCDSSDPSLVVLPFKNQGTVTFYGKFVASGV